MKNYEFSVYADEKGPVIEIRMYLSEPIELIDGLIPSRGKGKIKKRFATMEEADAWAEQLDMLLEGTEITVSQIKYARSLE
jgi:hypothetical protein